MKVGVGRGGVEESKIRREGGWLLCVMIEIWIRLINIEKIKVYGCRKRIVGKNGVKWKELG